MVNYYFRIYMIPLNLPSFEYTLKKSDGKTWILDIVRKKYVVLTPEEWVRQHFIHYMIAHLKYPRALVTVETGLVYNTLHKRCDITVFNRSGMPWLMVECKSPQQKINNDTLKQATVYNLTIQARYVVLTNGLKHICLKKESPESWINLSELPLFDL